MKSRRKRDKEQKSSERGALIGSSLLEHFQCCDSPLLRRRAVRAHWNDCDAGNDETHHHHQQHGSEGVAVAVAAACSVRLSASKQQVLASSVVSLPPTAANCRPRALECLTVCAVVASEQRHSYRSALVPVVSNHPQPVRVRTYIGEHLERVTVAFAFVVALAVTVTVAVDVFALRAPNLKLYLYFEPVFIRVSRIHIRIRHCLWVCTCVCVWGAISVAIVMVMFMSMSVLLLSLSSPPPLPPSSSVAASLGNPNVDSGLSRVQNHVTCASLPAANQALPDSSVCASQSITN